MNDYIPVGCDIYSRYELAILRQHRLRVSWRDAADQLHVDVLRPRNLITRNHAEFMLAERSDGIEMELRLDRIVKTQAL
jgi:Rho-binding antiterminator